MIQTPRVVRKFSAQMVQLIRTVTFNVAHILELRFGAHEFS
jgi:hypothetical protein